MDEEGAREPSRFQMFVYTVLDSLISLLGKLRMWVISPNGKYTKQYFGDVVEGLNKIKPDPYEPLFFACPKCQERYIIWELEHTFEIYPIWPEYAPDDDSVEELVDA